MIKETKETESIQCANCPAWYQLKKGPPELCWICGMPTGEKIENERNN